MNEQKTRLQLNSRNGAMTFAVFMATYVVLALLGQFVLGAIFGQQSTACRLICASLSSLVVLNAILFYVLYGRQEFTTLTSTKSVGGWYLLVATLLSCGMFLGLGFVNESLAQIFEAWGLNVGGIQISMPTVWHFLGYTLVYATLPAIFEEILFRGIILNCFKGMKRWISVLLSALLFALYHQSFVQFLYQFIYGVALGYLALLAKSIIPCMLAHFLNNFAVILFTFLKVNVNLFDPFILVVGANALAFFCAIVVIKERKAEKKQLVKGEIKNFFLPFGLLGILTCLAVAIGGLVG